MSPRASVPLLALLASACALEPAGVGVDVRLAGLTGPTADPGTPVLDELGIADLSAYPAFLMVRVEADDLDAPVVETWPEVVPEPGVTEVALELSVAPGRERRILVELVVAEEGFPARTLVSPGPGEAPEAVEVLAGRVVEVEPVVVELPTAPVRATWSSGAGVASVSWVDDRLGAALPPALASEGATEVDLAVGRAYWPRVALADGSVVDLDAQRVRAEEPETRVDVTLDLD